MKAAFIQIRRHRFSLLAVLTALVLCVSLLTRVALLIKSHSEFDFSILNTVGVFVLGLFFDLVNASYFILPLLFYLWLLPEKLFRKKWHRFILYGFFFAFIFLLLFDAVGEWFFWDEFNTRFNFIAVDYLVYTTEVIGNIRQSYPIEWIMTGLGVLSIAGTYMLREVIKLSSNYSMRFKNRTIWFFGFGSISLFSFFFVSNKLHHFSVNTYANELAGNGMYELFAAYRNNELNYDQFYPKVNEKIAFQDIHQFLRTKDARFISEEEFSLQRQVSHTGPERKLNVVLISIESFSALFMKSFGNKKNITPFLDSLTNHSLAFTNLYATGTRTVRGLEALSLCVPPIPGQSIIRRPGNENLFSLADVFNEKGYESKFVYGGYGYFDNMNYFFENNGYQVVDRSALSEEEIDYENIWGVADENLFALALREIDKTVSSGKPVFTHIMTTSNHRPFTYPEGRIDIPSHTSRAGAVKYTDYALRKFILEASKKDWFSNTVFVITADHCASSAGKTELPVEKYHIPMLMYSPHNIKPGVQDRLMSQIDVGPTLLGLLNFSYATKFWGNDINALPPGEERAFISTYQLLGYLKHDSLVVLAPNKSPEVFVIGRDHNQVSKVRRKASFALAKEAIAWYEASSYSFTHGLMKK
jgi:phosphoglycerol transferase MdoB-like AlkP superfamily enzyme